MSGTSFMPSRVSQSIFKACRQILSLCLIELISQAHAADLLNCSSQADRYINNTYGFKLASWVDRGICVRSNNNESLCYKAFDTTLKNLDSVRVGEYTGAASVLALLPTIGALLGAPTTEIWRLLTVVPFGGGLAMTLSFGGAILPVRVEDYENDLNRHKVAIKRSVASRAQQPGQLEDAQEEIYTGLEPVVEKILARMRQDESQQLAKGHLWVGLLVMILLSVGAQAAMIVVEQGGVIPWWCVSRWWMHLWYILVTENLTQSPFKDTWKLFVSDIPYDVNIRNGDSILRKLENPDASANQVLRQLGSLKAGTVELHGSKQYTRPRNAVLIMVSVTNRGQVNYRSALLRLFSKCASIATYVTGTALFASVQFLALPVAVMTLTLILAAGVFGRAITGWIVSGVSKTEPLIHVIVNTRQEAQHVIARILSLDHYGTQKPSGNEVRKVQVELGGHVFVSQRRVGSRSPWYLTILGVLAEPFDLRKVGVSETFSNMSQAGTDHSEVELGLMRE
ncbi:MAG: hypothetical protein Q9163_002454 [Psora crenata]